MRPLSSLVAVGSLVLTVASLLVIGVGALFALLLFFPLFVLALLVRLAGAENRAVPQRNPSTNPTRWRDGS